MKKFVPVLLAVLALGSLTWARGQRVSLQKNGRDDGQREQLKKLMAKVGVDVAAIEPRGNRTQAGSDQPQTFRELKIRLSDPTKPKPALSPAERMQTPAGQTQTLAGQTLNPAEQTQTPSASIVEDKRRSGVLPRHRSLELSPSQIFIAAVDATNKLRWWSIVPDPRVVRSEAQTASGELRAENYYVSNVTLVVAFPDDPEIANLRFYHPVWNGTDFDLKPLTNVPTR